MLTSRLRQKLAAADAAFQHKPIVIEKVQLLGTLVEPYKKRQERQVIFLSATKRTHALCMASISSPGGVFSRLCGLETCCKPWADSVAIPLVPDWPEGWRKDGHKDLTRLLNLLALWRHWLHPLDRVGKQGAGDCEGFRQKF